MEQELAERGLIGKMKESDVAQDYTRKVVDTVRGPQIRHERTHYDWAPEGHIKYRLW